MVDFLVAKIHKQEKNQKLTTKNDKKKAKRGIALEILLKNAPFKVTFWRGSFLNFGYRGTYIKIYIRELSDLFAYLDLYYLFVILKL